MSTPQGADAGRDGSTPPIRTVAGTGVAGSAGDNEAAVSAQLNRPYGIAVDGTGTLYFADYSGHRVRKITTDGVISTVAGTGAAGFKGDGGPAVSAQLNCPREVAVDRAGAVYVADSSNHRIRKITTDGKISAVAGTGVAGFRGDGGPADAAQLNLPLGVAVDSTGVLYIADYNNHRVRRITTDGVIGTVAGTGAAGFKGDGGPAVSAQLNCPAGLAVDSAGTLHVCDYGNHRVRRMTADGVIGTVAGTGVAGFSGDDGPAVAARLNSPLGVAVDSTGVLYIADYNNHRVRRVTVEGVIGTVAGTGAAGFGGDGGPAASAQLNGPRKVALDCVDTLYVTDHLNNRIRKLTSGKMAGRPESGTVVTWANVRSRLRMGVLRESTQDGAEIHQTLPVSRNHQRWRLVAAGQDDGDVLYRIENVRSGKVLEVVEAQERAGALVVQRGYEGGDAHHQHWRLIPVGPVSGDPRVYEIANRHSGLLLRVDTNACTAVRQHGAEGDHRGRQWQLLPV
ncbi:RICIN domain-containing protein [Streptomyces arenae]|uniref:NHL domain-containing protein n=1 Tax=Streptomyces arenae TaxID=29301 RepID=UPI002658F92A|nr:RICIN domain-containing protein [Streptomyces arenae]MCG7205620.1 RICIN domain-containing protein [Streptomyces arenae]